MKRNRLISAVCVLSLALSLCAGGCSEKKEEAASDIKTETQKVKKAEKEDINSVHLRDKDTLYADDDETSVVTMYLTVSRGNASENTDHSWSEINSYSVEDYENMGVDRYQVAGLLQVGDENGPTSGNVGYAEEVPNATVQIRGQTSSSNAQKNYKIELKKNKGTWRGQRVINLNKHQGEGMRFRNKMAYDLIKGIPQMMGLRTQFVHLYVKDNTDGSSDAFQDYGLYTQVEQLNKTALKTHGLDSKGQLYKVNSFEFYREEDVIKTTDDPGYNQEAFEERLEIKGDSDHTKLIHMLDAVNDYSIPINQVLEQYFDEENIVYWMAFQILTGNVDTQNRNMYLYSPQNSDTWYFIDWDNDGFFMRSEYGIRGWSDQGSWECGISNYWGNVLFQRCLKSDSFRKELDKAIIEMKDYLSEERLSTMISRYENVVRPYLYSMPDQMNAPLTQSQYDTVAAGIPEEVEKNYELYLESLEKPQPFYIGIPAIQDNALNLNWDVSYDFDAEDITYTVELATDYQFQNVIFRQEGVAVPEVQTSVPAAGQYFVRVRATDSSGKTQDAFDYYATDNGKNYGMKCFYVTADQRIEEDIYGKKIKNISHVGIAEHMKQLKNAEISERVGTAEYAGTAEHFRNEWKYLISTSEKELLELRMKHLLKKDPHASDGGYMIRSLYFDDYWNSAYEEKESGVLMRKKYRIRIYDYSDRSIKLERKKKFGSYIYKESAPLTREEVEKILAGEYEFLLHSPYSLCREFYIECVSNMMRPRTIVDYDRVPWIMDTGTVRITFDCDVRAAVGGYDIFDPTLATLPVLEPGKLVMEVKFTELLPQIIRNLLPPQSAEFTAVSKYVLCYEKTRYLNGFEYWAEN